MVDLEAARDKRLPDVLADDLTLVFVGINPSLYSAATGFHYARPGNRFWPSLHLAGITERKLEPFEQSELLAIGCGLTNIASRATARADELTNDELRAGFTQLKRKIRRRNIAAVAFLGMTAYRTAAGAAKAKVGRQSGDLASAAVYVLPNPSGLNAHYQLPDLAELYKQAYEETASRPPVELEKPR